MNDLISRQAAIDALEREKTLIERPITETRWFDLGLGKAQEVLSGLPSAQQWVPCSERLPKENEPVLGAFRFQGGDICLTTERIVVNGKERWSASCGVTPFAWMPLPEPYKAESEDKE